MSKLNQKKRVVSLPGTAATGIPAGKRVVLRMSPGLRSSSVGEIVPKLRSLYRQVDRDIARFQAATGLRCVKGCGHCCENPKVETTVAECLPLALYLHRTGQSEAILKSSAEAGGRGVCVFYSFAQTKDALGCCRAYQLRPLLCRLFGFSTITDKHGNPVLVTCAAIKAEFPGAIKKAQNHIAISRRFPVMNAYVRRLLSIDPSLNQEQMRINTAIEKAVLRVGMLLDYLQK